MSKKARIRLTSGDREGLEALIANRDTPRKRVRRAWIAPQAGNGAGTDEIQRGQDVSLPTIRRWRSRYMVAGADGSHRDKTCPPATAPIAAKAVVRMIEKTKTEMPPTGHRRSNGR